MSRTTNRFALVLATFVGVLCLSLSSRGAVSRPIEVSRQVYLMGTSTSLTTYADNRKAGLQQLEVLLRVLEETERELSTWREDSILTRLNRQALGEPFTSGPRLCRLFGMLVYWSEATGFTFDPAIGSLVKAWGLREGGRRPSSAALEQARKNSGMRHFLFDPSKCQIIREAEVTIDCGAFGKGEALDRILAASLPNSSPWLVDLGGQIMVHGRPPGRSAWSVAIAHPRLREKAHLKLELSSGSLSTSAGSERDLCVGGTRIGHHLDPRTGFPAEYDGSVTVWHERALVADILSTALYVMGPVDGLAWADANNVAACFLVIDDQERGKKAEVKIRSSKPFARRFPGLFAASR